MTHHEDRFAAANGLSLYEQAWLPEDEPAAVAVVVHGFIEHSGRYAPLAELLTARGYAVWAYDHQGHGRSEGAGVFVRRFDDYLDDLEISLRRVAGRHAGKPLLVFGHSMGGAITGLLAAAGRLDARGLALSAPAARTGPKVFPLLRHLAGIMGTLAPKLRIVRMGHGFVSRDPEVVEQFANDPLVFHERIPCRTGAEILAAAPRLMKSAPRIRLPLLILQGTGDVVVDPRGAEELHRRAGSSDKTLKLYPELYHDVLHEPERQQVLDDLLAWLDEHR